MIAAVGYSRRHPTFCVEANNVVDAELAGDLAIVTVEGVISDAFVAAELLVVGGRGQGETVDPGRRWRLGFGGFGSAFGWAWREMVCGRAFPYDLSR